MVEDAGDDEPAGELASLVARLGDATNSEARFERLLGALVGAALANDVAVAGGWEVRQDDDRPDYDVLITELRKPTAADRC